MQTENNEKMNFLEYVKWAFLENKNTMQNQEEHEILFCSLNSLDEEGMDQVIWLFRRCQSINKLESQNKLFTRQMFILNHIINFLLTILHYSKPTQEQISRLMRSIGIIQTEEELQLFLMENNELLSIEYQRGVVQKMEEINQEDFRNLFLVIVELKEIPKEQYLTINDLAVLFNQDNNPTQFQPSTLKQNFGIIIVQINQFQNNDFESRFQKSRIKLQNTQTIKQQLKFQDKQKSIKICKVIYKQEPQRKILLSDGTIVTGNIWITHQDQYSIPLSVSLQTQVNYFNFRIVHMNEDQFIRKDLVLSYEGPVNNNFDPNVSQAQYNLGIKGKLSQKRESQQYVYEGCFRDGFFDGQGSIFLGNNLYYDGEFKVGMKHGRGKELQSRDGDYLEGTFESGRKNGVFQFLKLTNGVNWQQNKSKTQIMYSNGKEVRNPNQGYQLGLKKKSSFTPSRSLLSFGEYGVNNYQLQSLQPGKWLNSSIIDIVINQIQSLRLLITKNYINDTNTVFINCNQFQDIFGSLVTKDVNIQTEIFKQIIENSVKKQPSRFVFYFNLDRGHFLSVVYENQRLYLIDSMKDKKADLLYQMKKLLIYFNFKVEDDWYDCKVSQQNNSYDCGMYTIYYISQIIKNLHLRIPQMIEQECFNVEQSRINYVRFHLERNLFQLGIELLEI